MKNETRGIVLIRGKYWWNQTVKGVRVWKNLNTSDLAQALLNLEKHRENPVLGTENALKDDVGRFVSFKVAQDEFTRNSSDKSSGILNGFATAYADETAATITPAMVQSWYDQLRKRVAESTAQSYVMAVRSFFKWAVEVERVRSDNPVEKVRLAKLPKKARVKFATREQRDKLIEHAPTDDLRFVLFCGSHAGFRRDEISEARVKWFDVAAGLTHIERTQTFRPKDREDRTIPMTAAFQAFLGPYLAGKHADDFALRPEIEHGKSRYRYDFRRPYNAFIESQGLRWITPHVLRHTFASLLASSGVSIYKIAKWLGDDVRVTQDHYAHLIPTDSDIQRLQ